jgi:hypothetical protein
MEDVKVTKGTRVLVRRMVIKPTGFSLAGAQMKFPATKEEFEGTISHIYGDRPVDPTHLWFAVRKDDGTEVEVEREHIAAVIQCDDVPASANDIPR